MRIERFAPLASTSLAAPISSSDTSISVVSAVGFPTEGDFRVLIDSELLLVTAVSGTTWTVQRGKENTTAAAHAAAAVVSGYLSAESLEKRLMDSQNQFWYPMLKRTGAQVTRVAADFTTLGSSPGTISNGPTTELIYTPGLHTNNTRLAGATLTTEPTQNATQGYSITANLHAPAAVRNVSPAFLGEKYGLGWRNSVGGQCLVALQFAGGNFVVWRMSTFLAFNSQVLSLTVPEASSYWIRATKYPGATSATTLLEFSISTDGVTFFPVYSETESAFMTDSNQVGLWVNNPVTASKPIVAKAWVEQVVYTPAASDTLTITEPNVAATPVTIHSVSASCTLTLTEAATSFIDGSGIDVAGTCTLTATDSADGIRETTGDATCTLVVSDSATPFQVLPVSSSDTQVMVDQASTLLVANASGTCTLVPTDSSSASLVAASDATCSLTPTDTATVSTLVSSDASCTLVPTDSASSVVVFPVDASCTLAPTDVASASAVFETSGACTLAPTDVASASAVFVASGSCTLAPTDVASASAVFATSGSCTLTPTDDATVSTLVASDASCTLAPTDVASASAVFETSGSCTLAPTDVASASAVFETSGSCTLAPTGVASASAVFATSGSCTLVPTDVASASAVFATSGSCTLAPTDDATVSTLVSADASCTLVPTDVASATAVLSPTASCTLAPTESATASAVFATSGSCTLSATDVAALALVQGATGSCTLLPTDAATGSILQTGTASCALTLTDSASEVLLQGGLASCTLTATDVAAATMTLVAAASCTLVPLDSASSASVLGGTATCTLTVTDLGSAAVVIEVTASDALTVTDRSDLDEPEPSEDFLDEMFDAATAALIRNVSATEDLTSISEQFIPPETLITTDTGLRDAASAYGDVELAATDTIGLWDAANRVWIPSTALSSSADDSLTITDQARQLIDLTASDSLTLTELATEVVGPVATESLSVSDSASATIDYAPVSASDVLGLNETIILELNRGEVGSAYVDPDDPFCGCCVETNYAPFVGSGPAPPLPYPAPGSVDGFRLQWPATGLVTDELILRNPNFGDQRRITTVRINRESRGGALQIYRDPLWPQVESLVVQFSALKETEAKALQDFILNHLGDEIRIIDHENRVWRGIIVIPDDPIVEDRRCSWTGSFSFEGVLV